MVQDVADGRVLMLAYMDAEALAATLASGEVHFHSRSRDRLWRKGETSGNVLRLRDIAVDCDGDALLLQVEPFGPTCHRVHAAASIGRRDGRGRPPLSSPTATVQGFEWLETLWATIDCPRRCDPASSYTARLLAAGVDGPARKVAEEATEVVMAAKDDAVAAPDRRAPPAMPWPVRWRICSTTPWSCSASAAWRRPR